MGLPNISITFKTTAAAAIARSEKGVVGLILRDSTTALQNKGFVIHSAADIPSTLAADNAAYIKRALIGYVNPPRKVVAYVLATRGESDATGASDISDGTDYFETQGDIDYLCGPADCTSAEAAAIATWVKGRRANDHSIVKAVLPDQEADSEGIVNVTVTGVKDADGAISTAALCSRIAGLIAGTPMTIACTYAPLPELTEVERLSAEEADNAVDAGEFILIHDGEKIKVARGVNSLTTTTQEKGAAFKKIKIVEAVDMIGHDIRLTCEDSYIGKYANSYDNKCVLIAAIKGYLEGLELAGILAVGKSTCEIDLAAQENYLKSTGTDTSAMSAQEIKEANTDDQVFLACSVKILDAIEDISINVTI